VLPTPGGRARVLVVCEGNICRSPAAEALMRSRLGGAAVDVRSVGLAARAGEPVDAAVRRLLQARGLPADGVSTPLSPALVSSADVVLTMTRDQRAGVVSRVPSAVRRTFALREFAALARLVDVAAEADPARRLAALVAAAGRARALRGPAGDDDDIPDPFRGSAEVHARTFALVDDAVTAVVAALTAGVAHSA
jgi:protein-tyrosine phosphatase